MAYIRPSSEERTGFQEHHPFTLSIHTGCDFVMVYGLSNLPERIRAYREAGYTIHLMTGIAWGDYADYLNGVFDGRKHWDESQRNRKGEDVLHGPGVPYLVPTESLAAYLTEKLKIAVDCGVRAIHMEEPEFWEESGYSDAFRREYEARTGRPFVPGHTDVNAHWHSSLLKRELYRDCMETVGRNLKNYARQKGYELRFYVPTHSIINYSQWRILSPEGMFLKSRTIDGFIAQVWTGTSRVVNLYEGVFGERVFETAYLEYGILEDLAGRDRDIWFLADPIEDCAGYDWGNYRLCYIQTLTASLLHPGVNRYEVCPWPHRVMEGLYPKDGDARPIPDNYRTFLSSMFQMLGDMESGTDDSSMPKVGVFLSDTCLMLRTCPDTVATDQKWLEELISFIWYRETGRIPEVRDRFRAFLDRTQWTEGVRNAYTSSILFPDFFGLAMPLLKHGLPLRTLLLEGIVRDGALENLDCLILSYSFMKPVSEELHSRLADWVQRGGALIYAGDGLDPWKDLDSWWQAEGYALPEEHLFDTLGLGRHPEAGTYAVGSGSAVILHVSPASFCLSRDAAQTWRNTVRDALSDKGLSWQSRNYLSIQRQAYIISCVMTESADDSPLVHTGRFVDLLEDGFPLIREKRLLPGESCILLDLDKVRECPAVLASSARILTMQLTGTSLQLKTLSAENVLTHIRLLVPGRLCVASLTAQDEDGPVPADLHSDPDSMTCLITYRSRGKTVHTEIRGADIG